MQQHQCRRAETFAAEAEAVEVRAGGLVEAGAGGGAVGPVEAGGAADGAVVPLDTKTETPSYFHTLTLN